VGREPSSSAATAAVASARAALAIAAGEGDALSVVEDADALAPSYLDHYHRLDPWMPSARSGPVGRCAPSEDFVPGHELDASEFYQDFLKPHGLREIVGGIADRSPDGAITTFALMRADGARSFDRSDAARLEPFLPRIRRALWID
jgi:hypothetical protein